MENGQPDDSSADSLPQGKPETIRRRIMFRCENLTMKLIDENVSMKFSKQQP